MKLKRKSLIISTVILSIVILSGAFISANGGPKGVINMFYSGADDGYARQGNPNQGDVIVRAAGTVAHNDTKNRDYTSLISAISEASSRDVISLKADITLTADAAGRIAINNKELTIKSDSTPRTISTASSALPMIKLTSSATLTLSNNVTINGTNFTGKSLVTAEGNSNLKLNNVTFKNVDVSTGNYTGNVITPGAIINLTGSKCDVNAVIITDCKGGMTPSGTSGGSTRYYSTAGNDYSSLIQLGSASTLTGTGLTVSGCSSTYAIVAQGTSSATLTTYSVSGGETGALYITDKSTGNITGLTSENTTGKYSGVVKVTGTNSAVTLTNSTIKKHNITTATNSSAVYVDANGKITLSGCSITENKAPANTKGAGMYVAHDSSKYGTVILKNKVIIKDNKASTVKSNLYAWDGTLMTGGSVLPLNINDLSNQSEIGIQLTVTENRTSFPTVYRYTRQEWDDEAGDFVDVVISVPETEGVAQSNDTTPNVVTKIAAKPALYKCFVSDDDLYITGYTDSNIIYGRKLQVTFDVEYGEGTMDNMYTCQGSKFVMPANNGHFTKYHCKFLYWGTKYDSDFTAEDMSDGDPGEIYNENEEVIINRNYNLHLHSRWQRYAAMIGSNYYLTVNEAFDAAQNTSVGTTIKLIGNSNITGKIQVKKNITMTVDASTIYSSTDDNLSLRCVARPAGNPSGTQLNQEEQNAIMAMNMDPVFEIINNAVFTLKGTETCTLQVSGISSEGLSAGSPLFLVTKGKLNLYENVELTDNENISNFGTVNEKYTRRGGGVYVCTGSTLNVRGALFTSNQAVMGAAVYLEGSDSTGAIMEMEHGKFGEGESMVGMPAEMRFNQTMVPRDGTDHYATDAGGAIYAGKGANLKITSGTFENNQACINDGKGGAIASYGATVVINDIRIEGCSANDAGGGIYANGGSLNITGNTTISGCEAANGSGGGLYIDNNCSYTLSKSSSENSLKIQNNKALNGGGIYLKKSSGTMNYGFIENNTANSRLDSTQGFGGGVYVGDGATFNPQNTSITGNSCYTGGGGIYVCPTGKMTASACKILNNKAEYVPSVGEESSEGDEEEEEEDPSTGGEDSAKGGGLYIDSNSTKFGDVVLASGEIQGNYGELAGGIYLSSKAKLQLKGKLIIKENTYSASTLVYQTEFCDLYIDENKKMTSGGILTGSEIYIYLNINGRVYGDFMLNDDTATEDSKYFFPDKARTLDDDGNEIVEVSAVKYVVGVNGKTLFVNREISVIFLDGVLGEQNNGDEVEPIRVAYGGTVVLPYNRFKNAGYTFDYWQCDLFDPEDENNRFKPGDSFVIPDNIETLMEVHVTAIWSNNVARIKTKYYTSIESAVMAAEDATTDEDSTIYILKDLELNKPLTITKKVIITSDETSAGSDAGQYGFFRGTDNSMKTQSLIYVLKDATADQDGRLTLSNVFVSGEYSETSMGIPTANSSLIYVTGTLATINGTTLKNGYSSGRGGAVSVMGEGVYNCRDSRIIGNRAQNGAGIYINCTAANDIDNLYINNSKVSKNRASGYGGGIYVSGTTKVTIEGNSMIGGPNDSDGNMGNYAISGAGLCLEGGTINIGAAQVSYNVINSTDYNNNSKMGGAGIYLGGAQLTLGNVNSVVSNNNLNVSGRTTYGAGIFVSSPASSFKMANGSVINNNGGNQTIGGGIYTATAVNVTGTSVIKDNKTGVKDSNLYLDGTKLIKLEGATKIGSEVHVSLNDATNTGPLLTDSSRTYLTDAGVTTLFASTLVPDNTRFIIYPLYNVASNSYTSERNIYITKEITVTYDYNGGTSSTIPATQVIYSDLTNKLYTNKSITRTGYEINGTANYWRSREGSFDAQNCYYKTGNSTDNFSIQIQWSPLQIEVITTGNNFALTYGITVQHELNISILNDAEDGPNVQYKLDGGKIPPGLTLSGKTLWGTPNQPGPYNFTLKITGRNGTEAYAYFQIKIGNAPGKVTFDNDVSKYYDGIPMAYPAYTRLGTGNVTITFNGLDTPPTEAGEYEVVIAVAEDEYYNAVTVSKKFYIYKINRGFTEKSVTTTKIYDALPAQIDEVYIEVYTALAGTYNYEFWWYDSPSVANSDTNGSRAREEVPVDVGTYYVKMFTEGDNNYYDDISKVYTYTITQREVRVVWKDTQFTYDTKAHKPSATFDNNIPNNHIIYDLETEGLQTEVGSYVANVTQAAKNTFYNFKLIGTECPFTIIRADTTVNITTTPMNKTYDGYPPSLEFFTVSDGTPSFVWYKEDGKTVINPPTERGNYKVKVTVTQGHNYNATESQMYEFVINPKRINAVWSNLEFTYTVDRIENDHEIAVVYVPSAYYMTVFNEHIDLVVSGAQSQAGTYTASVNEVTADRNYIIDNYRMEFVINKAAGSIWNTGSLSRDYNGQTVAGDNAFSWIGDGIRRYRYTDAEGTVLDSAPKDAGRYSVSAFLEEGKNYLASSDYTQPVWFEIYKLDGSIQINTDAQFSKIYDGLPVSMYDQVGKKKYTVNGELPVQIDWYTFDGDYVCGGLDLGANEEGTGANGPIEEGSYRVVVTLPDSVNYYGASDYATFNIKKLEGAVKITANLNKTYDGQPAHLETYGADGSIVDNGYEYIVPEGDITPTIVVKWYDKMMHELESAPVNAGNYTVVVTQLIEVKIEMVTVDQYGNEHVGDPVTYTNESTDRRGFTIAKAMPSVQAPEVQTKVYDGQPFSLQYEAVTDGKVYVAWYKGSEKIEYVPTNAGSYSAYIELYEGDNYVAYNYTGITVKIDKAPSIIEPISTYQEMSKPYDGYAIEEPEYRVVQGDGRTWVVWYTDASQISSPPTEAGSYIARIVIAETDNYYGASVDIGKVKYTTDENGVNVVDPSEMIIIGQLTGTITLVNTDISKEYDGYAATAPTYHTTGSVSIYWYKRNGSDLQLLDSPPVGAGDYTVKLIYLATTNWASTEESVDFTIYKKPITAKLTEIFRRYNGSTAVTLEEGEYSFEGLVGRDVVKLVANGNFTSKNANVTDEDYYQRAYFNNMYIMGDDSVNYTLAETSASTIGRILPIQLVLTPDENQSKYETDKDPVLTYTTTGLVSGDTVSGELTRAPGEYVGRYAIMKGTVDAGANYVLTFTEGVEFIIKSRPMYSIDLDYDGNGSIAPANVVNVIKNEDQTYYFTPGQGYLIASVIVDGEDLGPMNSYTFTKVSSSHSLYVVFEPDVMELNVKDETNNSVTLQWKKVENAVKYDIERSNDGVNFTRVAQVNDPEATTYVDKGLSAIRTYYYRVMPYITDGENTTKLYYTKIAVAETIIGEPVLVKAESTNYNAITITWKPCDGADGYYIYRYSDVDSAWIKIGVAEGQSKSSYTDKTVENGETYRYTVRAYVIQDGEESLSSYNTTGKKATAMPNTPKITEVTLSGRTGVTVKWGAISGAESYNVYRSQTSATSGWKLIKNLKGRTNTEFTDTGLTEGTTYYYTVRAIRESVMSKYNNGEEIRLIPQTPVISKVANAAYNKLKVTWGKVSDCDGYVLYRSIKENGDWTKITTVTSGTTATYTDTVPTCGVTYYYMIKAYWNDTSKYVYSDASGAVSGHTLPTKPSLKSAISVGYNSIKLTWDKIAEADGYKILRTENSDGTGWKTVKTLAGGTKTAYTDTTAETGKTYYYSIRSYVKPETTVIMSGYDKPGMTAKAVPSTPKISSATATGGRQITLKWAKIAGADGYIVYRSLKSDSEWKNIQNIKNGDAESYVDEAAVPGTQYYYTIKAYTAGESGNIYSGYEKEGIGAKTSVGKAQLSSVTTAGYNSVLLKWKKVAGADGYAIYRSTTSGSGLKKIKTVKGTVTSYTDATAVYNTQYYYSVRAYCTLDGTNYYGAYDTTGTAGKATAIPPEFTVKCESISKIKISWSKVADADGYIVYKTLKSDGTSFKTLQNVASTVTSCIDTDVECGTTYYYTVRSYKTIDGKLVKSSYIKTGIACTAAPAEPKVTAQQQQDGTVLIGWNAVEGAVKFRVYRRPVGGKWTTVTTETSDVLVYMDMSEEINGKTDYEYTVRAIAENGTMSTFTPVKIKVYVDPNPV